MIPQLRSAGDRAVVAGIIAAAILMVCYVSGVERDGIAGLFGVFWSDEGTYLLSARNQALFGTAHFFDADRWRPEWMSPLSHYYALLTISPDNPTQLMRMGVAIQVLLGMGIIAWLAAKYHASPRHALACLLCLLLNPVLFFYARVGLAEGMQFLVLSFILVGLFYLGSAPSFKRALAIAALCGALTSVLFFSKISAIGIAIGCSIGAAWTIGTNQRLTPIQKLWGCLGFGLGGLAVAYAYLGLWLGPDFSGWWSVNIEEHAAGQVDMSLADRLSHFHLKFAYLAYFTSLMPVFALFFFALPMAADRSRGFVFTLLIIALATMLVEVVIVNPSTMGTIRRNFFSLTMASVLFGFLCLEFIESGVRWRFKGYPLMIPAMLAFLLYAYGMGFFAQWIVRQGDRLYSIFTLVFLAVTALLIICSRSPEWRRQRAVIASALALFAFAPMPYQAFFAPQTRLEINASLEQSLPENAVILSYVAPWYLQGLKHKVIFTNCKYPGSSLGYVNDIDQVPAFSAPTYFISERKIEQEVCPPSDYRNYQPRALYRVYIPENYGGLYSFSENWRIYRHLYVYEKH